MKKMLDMKKREQNNDTKKVMKWNERISKKETLIKIIAVLDIVILLIIHILYNLIWSIPDMMKMELTMGEVFSLKRLLTFRHFSGVLFFFSLLLIAFYDVYFIYKVRVSYSMEPYNIGQKGKQRFTTLEEVKEQYKEIPEKDLRYPGEPGFLVTRYLDKIYIDTSPVNNLIIGLTRSGKGECLILPLIDIYSRAEFQPSMIITDIKIDMYPKARKILEERGYVVGLLNFVTPSLSTFRFNPLSIIIEEMKKGNIADAENMCNAFCYSIYFGEGQPASGDASFFANTSTQLVSAAILALTTDCLGEDKRMNQSRMDTWERKQGLFKKLESDKQNKAREIFRLEKEKDPEGVIWNIKYIPDDEEFIPTTENEKKINMVSVVNTFTELSRIQISPKMTMLDFYFQRRPDLDRAKLLYASTEVSGDRTKGNIMSNALSKLLLFTYSDIAQLTAETTIKLSDIGFGEKPAAIFVALPDYDHSKDFLLSVFNRQVYYITSKLASEQPNGRTKRLVKFEWDEFGNMPAVDNADSMVTSGLGRGISFDLVVQSYSQMDDKYGRKAETIRSNCGNKMYLLTDDKSTAEEVSEILGSKTITTASRMGSKFSLNKTITESWEERPLKYPTELMNFRQGETVLMRTMKRTDLKGRDIISYPIYSCPEEGTRLKYQYTYLQDTFPGNISYVDVIKDELVELDMSKRVWDYKQVYYWLQEDQKMPEVPNKSPSEQAGTYGALTTYKQVEKILKQQLQDEYDPVELYPEMAIDELIQVICGLEMDPKVIKQIMNLIERG